MITTLKVSGMHCRSCEELIKESLRDFDGVQGAAADFASGTVTITHKDSSELHKKLRKTIIDLGYRVS